MAEKVGSNLTTYYFYFIYFFFIFFFINFFACKLLVIWPVNNKQNDEIYIHVHVNTGA